ncbi:hypothetical protein AW40_07170 [Kosakonia radicincitans UMEnt01/12]|uniref:hypothetical protein n=1 Tax=Kosakonia radicincitans TaxID=283686 RepID=UPI000460FB34|nr:hypothetical protein [Kosakonia radicincitans]KDE37419.1 hypothetical protein AW40_07170 [Kosakonia radicincitans UMEnt01/12]
MLFKRKFTLEADPASWTAGAAVISAAIGGYSAIQNANQKGGATIKATQPVTQDTSTAQADDLLRRRQRQGTQGNVTGASGTSVNSSGQKTLLGG